MNSDNNGKSNSQISHQKVKNSIKKNGIENLIEILRSELRSIKCTRAFSNQISNRCSIRLHNCTPYRVTPFWIDHKGLPLEYPTLNFAAFLDLDTYVSHLWFFKTHRIESTASNDQTESKKVLALPEEILDLLCKENKLSTSFIGANYQSELNGESNCFSLCALCKHVKEHFSIVPTKVICPHYSGEAKFSCSDKSWQGCYIYTCDDNTHKSDHATRRRNIYLVEPFFSLRERCFLTLEKHINDTEIVGLDLPVSLQREYLRFITIVQKLDENK